MLSLPEARDYAIKSELPPPGRLLLLMLASRTNGEPICWPSIDTLTRDTGLSRSTVIRWVERLEREGFITVTPGGGRGKSNVYQLVTETVSERNGFTVTPEGDLEPNSGEPSRESKDHVDLTVSQRNGFTGRPFSGPITKEQQAFPGGYVPEQVNRRRSRPPGGRQNKPKQPAPIPSDGQAAASTAAGRAFSEERPRFLSRAERLEQQKAAQDDVIQRTLAERRAQREGKA